MERSPQPIALSRRIEPAALVCALWAWLTLALLLAFFGWITLAQRAEPAALLGLAAVPALGMFLLLPHWDRPWAGAAMAALWTGFAVSACVATGGAGSPLLCAFLIGPALALRMGDARTAGEALVFAALGYAFATVAAPQSTPPDGLMLRAAAFFCLVLAAWILAAPATGEWRAAPSPPTPPAPAASASALHAAAMAHELRTPLNHIMGFAEMMQAQVFGPLHEKYVEYAGLIRTSGGHLLSLVNDMLDLAKIESGQLALKPEPIDAASIARSVVAQAQGQAAPKSIALAISGPDALPAVADPRVLTQILINIVGNAVKFTPEAGAVRLSVARQDRDILFTVTDTGPGFPLTAFARLGAPYQRGDNVGENTGTGLGLALVRAMSEAQGGRLTLANGDEEGAVVTVRLPIAAAD